ncbi:ciliogenesis and planar polarity effector 1-like [Amblyraja radiata]|uniref:ciliogenesis and planar polarity effector 1-like n=1 Tax=Amblyraja radiata TaxID=386614 RepID=UPI001401C098|nr:ciliogenesis and planar polarity effector 1-like [Amblyraja radiata]
MVCGWQKGEKEAILLSDVQRLCVLSLSTGRTQRKIGKLQPLLKNVLSVTTSANGSWLAGVLTTGELFLWRKDADCLKTVGAVEGVSALAAAAQNSTVKLSLFVSNDGKRVLLLAQVGAAFLWESLEEQDLPSVPGARLGGRWAEVLPDGQASLPQGEDMESAVHAVFVADEVLGDCCLACFAFISGEALVLTTVRLHWFEQVERCIRAAPLRVQWATQTQLLGELVPACQPVKSRGALLAAFTTDGSLLALAINQINPKATQVLFVKPMSCVTVSTSLQGCGSTARPVLASSARSYWVAGVSWTPDGLFLACMLQRGALLMLSRLGELVTLTTSGCSVELKRDFQTQARLPD